MIGKTIGGATIAALVLGVTVNSNKVVKQHAGDQESSPLTLFRRPEWFSPPDLCKTTPLSGLTLNGYSKPLQAPATIL